MVKVREVKINDWTWQIQMYDTTKGMSNEAFDWVVFVIKSPLPLKRQWQITFPMFEGATNTQANVMVRMLRAAQALENSLTIKDCINENNN